MDFRQETARLNSTTIKRVGELLGLKLPLRGTVRCPLPNHDDKNPSFEVRKEGTRWNCYGCNRSGGAIDLVKHYQGVDFTTAKRWLAQRLDYKRSSPSRAGAERESRRSASIPVPLHDQTRENPPDLGVYEALLQQSPLQQQGLDYLLLRSLSPTTIAVHRIGQIGDSRTMLDFLIRNFGYQRVEAAGLLTKRSTRSHNRLVFGTGDILFPFIENDRVVYLQTRNALPNSGSIKWRNLSNRTRRIYNVDALHGPQDVPFAVCEGAIDALSAIELGYSAIGLLGANAQLGGTQLKVLRKKRVHILLDWDHTGERRATQLQHEFRRNGIVSVRKSRPSPNAKDVNDYLRELRKEDGTV